MEHATIGNAQDRDTPFDYEQLHTRVLALAEREKETVTLSYLCESILGRAIPLLRIGNGRREVLYVGAHHGMEWITSALLVRFSEELAAAVGRDARIGGIPVAHLLSTTSLYILPMLNPDGVSYQIHGLPVGHPICERVREMNGGSEDLSRWQANARGVDLNHNYDAGFAEYKQLEETYGIPNGAPSRYSGACAESEPEVRALCNLIRFLPHLVGVMTLHTQGEEIYYQSGGVLLPRSEAIARRLSQLTGYRLAVAQGLAAHGGLSDWCIRTRSLPAFTVECGKGENPLPFSRFSSVYARLRASLFAFPTLL